MSENSSLSTNFTLLEAFGGLEYVRLHGLVYIPYMVITSLVAVFGTIGNILLICVICVSKELHNVGNLLLVNLAAADVLVASFTNGQSLIGTFFGEKTFLEPIAVCLTVAAIAQLVSNCGLFTLPAIAVNRYIKICRPHLYEKFFSRRLTIAYCVVIWLLSLASVSIQFTGLPPYTFDRKTMACMSDRNSPLSLKICIISLFVFGPGGVSAFCYSRIFLVVRASKRRVNASGRSSSKVDVNLSLTLFLIWVVYLAMMLPICILFVVDTNDLLPTWPYPYALVIACANTVVNPILYGLTNKTFRNGFRVVLCIDKCSSPNSSRTAVGQLVASIHQTTSELV